MLCWLPLFAVLVSGCATREPGDDRREALLAVLWTQTSAEYRGATRQAYRLAASNLNRALAEPAWTAALEQDGADDDLPPAIILDLDQTVLDTGPYNAGLIRDRERHTQRRFAEWCRDSPAPAIPGARDFILHAVRLGVAVFYISARHETLRDCTAGNLRALGLPLAGPGHLLLKRDKPATRKTLQRARVAERLRVLLLIGDDLNDFVDGAKSDPETRGALVEAHRERWGAQWILLPNPMFGSWEGALHGFDYGLPHAQRLDRLIRRLQRPSGP
jgi:acid phosphatase